MQEKLGSVFKVPKALVLSSHRFLRHWKVILKKPEPGFSQ